MWCRWGPSFLRQGESLFEAADVGGHPSLAMDDSAALFVGCGYGTRLTDMLRVHHAVPADTTTATGSDGHLGNAGWTPLRS